MNEQYCVNCNKDTYYKFDLIRAIETMTGLKTSNMINGIKITKQFIYSDPELVTAGLCLKCFTRGKIINSFLLGLIYLTVFIVIALLIFLMAFLYFNSDPIRFTGEQILNKAFIISISAASFIFLMIFIFNILKKKYESSNLPSLVSISRWIWKIFKNFLFGFINLIIFAFISIIVFLLTIIFSEKDSSNRAIIITLTISSIIMIAIFVYWIIKKNKKIGKRKKNPKPAPADPLLYEKNIQTAEFFARVYLNKKKYNKGIRYFTTEEWEKMQKTGKHPDSD